MHEHQDNSQPKKIRVWDLPTRLFHWGLVACVTIGFITGYISPEWWMGAHIWAGYATVVLIVFRLIWGIFGSEYSRIETFAFTPAEVFSHLRELIFLRPLHFIGHNPAGAMMVFTLLFILIGITLSGLMVLGGEENQGPLAGAVNYAVGDAAADVHNILVYLLLGLVVLHIGGVLIEIKLTGEDLVQSMITGDKELPDGQTPPAMRKARPGAAIVMLSLFVIIAGSTLWAFSTMPPSGLISMPANEAYETECGDCHQVYHPALLPIASWQKIMLGLDDHFGEDASLNQATAIEITGYLTAYGSERWDTESANRFRNVSPTDPLRITATPYWVRKHSEIKEDVFKRKPIGSKGHCAACHQDDATGRFDDQKIKIPPPPQ